MQWADAWWPRQQWDYAWGAPPYSFPQGHQSHVMYYAAAPYYYLGFQTSMGYNGTSGIRPLCNMQIRPDRADFIRVRTA